MFSQGKHLILIQKQKLHNNYYRTSIVLVPVQQLLFSNSIGIHVTCPLSLFERRREREGERERRRGERGERERGIGGEGERERGGEMA